MCRSGHAAASNPSDPLIEESLVSPPDRSARHPRGTRAVGLARRKALGLFPRSLTGSVPAPKRNGPVWPAIHRRLSSGRGMVVVDREERHVPIGAGGFEKSIPGERRPGLADVRMSAVVHMISLKANAARIHDRDSPRVPHEPGDV